MLHVFKEIKVFITTTCASKSILNTNVSRFCAHLLPVSAFALHSFSLSTLLSWLSLFVSLSISYHSPNLPLFPDDGALRIWKNFADQKNPEMVTAWQGLSDMLPTTRGQPSASAHSKDQCSILLCTPHQPILPQFTVHIHLQVTCLLPNCSPHPTHTPSPSNQQSFQVGQASTFSFPVLLLNAVTVDCMSL